MLFWLESLIKSHRLYCFLNGGCAEGALARVGTGAPRLSQPLSRLFVGMYDSLPKEKRRQFSCGLSAQNSDDSTCERQPLQGKKKKAGDKEEICVFGGRVYVVVDSNSQAALLTL